MRAVIQKTVGAKVDVVSENGTETCGKIDGGFVVLLGVTHSDIENTLCRRQNRPFARV